MVHSCREGLAPLVLRDIKSAYFKKEIQRTSNVILDMSADKFNEADVEKFFDEVASIYKIEKAHSPRRNHDSNTHYYMWGVSIDGRDIFCKVASTYHPDTGHFMYWTLTSFCEWKDNY
jgi:hypothetical protein